MKKTLFALSLFVVHLAAQAQTNLDSLWSIWNNTSQSDTSRLDAMDRFARDGYLFGQPDSAFYYASMGYNYAKSKGLKQNMRQALMTMATSMRLQGEIDSALIILQQARVLDKALKDKRGEMIILGTMGNLYNMQANYPKALEYFNKSLELSPELDDVENIMAACIGNIAVIHHEQGDYVKALKYFEESLVLFEKINSQNAIALTLCNIGNVYSGMKDHSASLEYYQKGLEANLALGEKKGAATALNGLSSAYYNLKEYDKALNAAEQALEIATEVKDQTVIASALHMIGTIYSKKGEWKKAIDYCTKGQTIAEQSGSVAQKTDNCKCLYEAYKAIGNDKLALHFHEEMLELKDSLFNKENTKKITELEMQYQFSKKEAAAQAKQEKKDVIAMQELKRQKLVRNGFMGGFAVVLLFAAVFFTQRNRISKEKERSEELLLNILPEEVAKELKYKGFSDAQHIDHVTVLFTDFKGFTVLSEQLTPKELVKELHECFSAFDRICEKYRIEKIKTIGDAYMAAGGLPLPTTTHAHDITLAALEMAEIIETAKTKKKAVAEPFFEIRIGIHTGPVVAGIVGVKKFQYDILGDTVNTASRMESSGEVGKINISQSTYEMLKNDRQFSFESRGKIEAKGKGEMDMYFVSLA